MTHIVEPLLPPRLTGHAVSGPALAHAVRGAASGRYGAGDVLYRPDPRALDMAIVLEPEVPLSRCCEMLPTGMVAFADALGARVPPDVAVMFRWPDIILVNGATVGHAKMVTAENAASDSIPAWLVLVLGCALRPVRLDRDVGRHPDKTTLWDEGCGEITDVALLESLARHFVNWLNTWQTEGFRPVHDHWLARAQGHEDRIEIVHDGTAYSGVFVGLDEHGNLLLRDAQGLRVLTLPVDGAAEP